MENETKIIKGHVLQKNSEQIKIQHINDVTTCKKIYCISVKYD